MKAIAVERREAHGKWIEKKGFFMSLDSLFESNEGKQIIRDIDNECENELIRHPEYQGLEEFIRGRFEESGVVLFSHRGGSMSVGPLEGNDEAWNMMIFEIELI